MKINCFSFYIFYLTGEKMYILGDPKTKCDYGLKGTVLALINF